MPILTGTTSGSHSGRTAQAKKRQRQDSDDEESGQTVSDNERDTGNDASSKAQQSPLACAKLLLHPCCRHQHVGINTALYLC